ncbi:uncharacterized protein HMPREF1541_01100 [Cyphellophora europaea CBS 101466]|uniref:Galactosyl transferase GMA12/MNN10 family protein n=1 Tax=Cyphellophora europaea (strain CBS 101466) TaxID=1220924 RepID=W2SDX2_CYPE1|nr:uncharacterized protein HMPREF1541_01100 [Cyphellophora europaea CBS 101466]ETN46911.1 hypothetical protein HMPREF1541_01100 [Cyphellophora europaea CBS 101466]
MLDLSAFVRSRLLLATGAIILFLFTFRALNESTALRPYLSSESSQPAAGQSSSDPVSIIYDPRPEWSGRPDVAKVSMMYGENELYDRAIDTHLRHAQRHGYPAYVLKKELITGVWNKLLYLIHVMVAEMHRGEQGAKWIMWFDADSAVINPALPLSIFLPPEEWSDIHLLASKDQAGFNAGMFLIKINDWSIRTLAQAMTYEWHKPDIKLDFLEQTSLYHELNHTANREHVLYQPRKWFNTYEFHHAYEGEKGDMMVHFPGLQEDRWNHMATWLEILEGPGQKEWEVPLEQTRYPKLIAEFWETLKSGKTTLENGKQQMKQSDDASSELAGAVAHLETVMWSETDQPDAVTGAVSEVQQHMAPLTIDGKAANTEMRSDSF